MRPVDCGTGQGLACLRDIFDDLGIPNCGFSGDSRSSGGLDAAAASS